MLPVKDWVICGQVVFWKSTTIIHLVRFYTSNGISHFRPTNIHLLHITPTPSLHQLQQEQLSDAPSATILISSPPKKPNVCGMIIEDLNLLRSIPLSGALFIWLLISSSVSRAQDAMQHVRRCEFLHTWFFFSQSHLHLLPHKGRQCLYLHYHSGHLFLLSI